MIYIARIYNNFSEKFGIPRQSGLVGNSLSRIVFEPEFRNPDAFRGLEGFSHIWLIWEFSEAVRKGGDSRWKPTVRPPRLGGNERIGVFASRSPFRPNPIGLSCVKLEKIEFDTSDGPVLAVRGADLMNGTPIYDIKPYIPYADAHPDARGGFTDEKEFKTVKVSFTEQAEGKMSTDEQEELRELLARDPRPAYKRNEKKTYRFEFAGREIEFEGEGESIKVTNIY
ncbi:MAG: tRNA (N6-threonylcarbamoyladenosine(37)-N6)-methyltransferase TrmO [Lachnospiraceae bacterium]|nr:tRNA (N6-threonylcarbamoyladenosine(37)-N6)-methyltransferase TrmO [Lachnospiraceae bacterium]